MRVICANNEADHVNDTISESQCPPWSYLDNNIDNTSIQCKCCDVDKHLIGVVSCTDQHSLLQLGYCMTYEEGKGIFFTTCLYSDYRVYNISQSEYIQLPNHNFLLNSSMCEPLHRMGRVCGECKVGYALAVNSYNYKCVKCTDKWYGAFLYLSIELISVTVLYFILLVFRIRLTSSPMTCFIMYSQILVFIIHTDKTEIERLNLQTHCKGINYLERFIEGMYGMTHLDFFRYMVPEFCINSKLKIIHVQLLGYISAFYLLFLLILTWTCIELHDLNFKPFVILWKPFHRCCVRLRREWSTKYDITDVFASFLLLISGKFTYQSIQLLGVRHVWNKNGSKEVTYTPVTLFDPTVSYFSPKDHLPYAIIGIFSLLVFAILPTLVLTLYPVKAVRNCTSKVGLTGYKQAALQTFVEKFHNCYRDGLDGNRDMRSISGLYFILRGVTIASHQLYHIQLTEITWIFRTILFTVSALLIGYLKPFKKWYMNFIDTLILSLLAFLFFMFTIHTSTRSQLLHIHLFSAGIKVSACIPLIIFITYGIYTVVLKTVTFVFRRRLAT